MMESPPIDKAVESTDTASTSVQPIIPAKRNRAYEILKQVFDLVSALCVSIALCIPMAIIALMIVMKDPGNPFFMHKRVGKDGKDIYILKFRSMKIGADDLEKMLTPEQLEEYRKEYKLKDDPRLIGYKKPGDGSKCFGSIIRRTSIDELPQIPYNICLRGNMSVVGPRPLLRDELEKNYSPAEQLAFTSVKPGLTGYWQAYARNNATYESGERQKMELYYVQNRSAMLDIKILFQTVITVLKKAGAE